MGSDDKTINDEQRLLENAMVSRGHERHQERQENLPGSKQEAPHSEIVQAIQKVSEVITQSIHEDEARFKSGSGKPSVWYEELKDQDPHTLAYLGLNVCYDSVITNQTYGATLCNIGARLENERFAKELEKHDKRLFKRLVAQVTKDHKSERYRFKAAKIIAGKEGFKLDKWSTTLKSALASPIVNAVLKAVDIFVVTEHVVSTPVPKGRKLNVKTARHIGLTDEAERLVREKAFDASWASPMFGPLLVPPKPWDAFDTGVYEHELLSNITPLVRKASHEQRKAIMHDFTKGEPAYVTALNALQATPLTVNRHVTEAIVWCYENKLEPNDFPIMSPPDYPVYPQDPENHDEAYLRQVIKDRKKWHEIKREAQSNLVVMNEDIKTLRHLQDYDQFYLGWSLDYRQRFYPVSFYSMHRADSIRATFLFAKGKVLDKTAQGWLMIQIANTCDFDKISKASLEDRIDWVLKNEEMILAIGNDFRATYNIWAKSDKPFQFLAACRCYRDMVADPENYQCHLPISLDGTSSGTQHYSLASKHEDGALVNLVPSDRCEDLYQVVADAVIARLMVEKDPMAQVWLKHGITRKTVKRNCMCFGYNSLQRGMGDQIMDDLMAPLQKQKSYGKIEEHPFGTELEQIYYARFLANINYEVISATLSSVATGMAFLQSYADALAREGKSVRWTTPSGFPAVQKYTKSKAKRVKLFLYDRDAKMLKKTRINVHEDTDVADTRKARSGIAANWVHSLDASHMTLSILSGLDNGITDFFMIHDSFGTLGADTWQFYHCIRATLVDMYDDNCYYSSFADDCLERLAETDPEKLSKLATVPPKGNLDVSAVKDSEYCFS